MNLTTQITLIFLTMTKLESKTYDFVQLPLVVAKSHDLDKFKKPGFLYFVKKPETQEFYEYPFYTYKGMDIQEFYFRFHLECVYIPINPIELFYLKREYEKKI